MIMACLLLAFSTILVFQMIQVSLLVYLVHRVHQDKNAAVGFMKNVWFQFQSDLFNFMLSKNSDMSSTNSEPLQQSSVE